MSAPRLLCLCPHTYDQLFLFEGSTAGPSHYCVQHQALLILATASTSSPQIEITSSFTFWVPQKGAHRSILGQGKHGLITLLSIENERAVSPESPPDRYR